MKAIIVFVTITQAAMAQECQPTEKNIELIVVNAVSDSKTQMSQCGGQSVEQYQWQRNHPNSAYYPEPIGFSCDYGTMVGTKLKGDLTFEGLALNDWLICTPKFQPYHHANSGSN